MKRRIHHPMILTINLNQINKAGITPNEVFYIIGIYQNQPVSYYQDLTNLESKGYLKRFIDEETSQYSIVLRAPAIKLCKSLNLESSNNIEDFVEEYRSLFPVGVKNNGQPLRGDKQGCIKKMMWFKRTFNYSNDEILEAVRVYLTIKKKDGYRYTQLAHYFIEKEGLSSLAAMCEDIRLNGTKSNNIETKEGVGTVEGI